MFVDTAQIRVIAGKGGDGNVSFRHEKFVANGGPDGGDGGDGGDVVFVASRNQDTLATFRYQKELRAEPGQPGGRRKQHGKNGADLRVAVPVGTAVLDAEGNTLADLALDGQEAVIALGGKGGFGNAHFTSSVRQAPRVAEKGEQGDDLALVLELRVIADVGLVGLPNAGKSSFLAAVSNARPEVADYPFTTLTPHLGVVDIDSDSLLIADIPGLIEGASEGKGLGDAFLKHVSRCSVLLHLIDTGQEDAAGTYRTIRGELEAYGHGLETKPEIVALTKIELYDDEIINMQKQSLQSAGADQVYALSAYAKKGLDQILYAIKEIVLRHRQEVREQQQVEESTLPVITLADKPDAWQIVEGENCYIVTGKKIERFADRTDFGNVFAVERLRDILKKMGILRELRRRGIEPDTKIIIGDPPRGEITY